MELKNGLRGPRIKFNRQERKDGWPRSVSAELALDVAAMQLDRAHTLAANIDEDFFVVEGRFPDASADTMEITPDFQRAARLMRDAAEVSRLLANN